MSKPRSTRSPGKKTTTTQSTQPEAKSNAPNAPGPTIYDLDSRQHHGFKPRWQSPGVGLVPSDSSAHRWYASSRAAASFSTQPTSSSRSTQSSPTEQSSTRGQSAASSKEIGRASCR